MIEYVFVLASGEVDIRSADSARHAACIAQNLGAKAHHTAAEWETMNHNARCLLLEA